MQRVTILAKWKFSKCYEKNELPHPHEYQPLIVWGEVGVRGVGAPGVAGRSTVWVRVMGLLTGMPGVAGVLVGVVGVDAVEAGVGISYFCICGHKYYSHVKSECTKQNKNLETH